MANLMEYCSQVCFTALIIILIVYTVTQVGAYHYQHTLYIVYPFGPPKGPRSTSSSNLTHLSCHAIGTAASLN